MALLRELRFAARMLGRNKGWTMVAALALALGLGSNIAIFSVVRVLVWTPLPYPHPEQLVYLPQTNAERGFTRAASSLVDARDWATASAIATVGCYRTRPMALSGQGEPQHLPAMQVTPGFFETLAIQPAAGRAFRAEETPETEARAAIISHELWQGIFRGEPVLGKDIRLDDRNYAIVGVMPAGFQFYANQRADVWVPLALKAEERERGWRGLNTIARLKPGVTIRQAAAEIRAVSERIEKEDSVHGKGWRGDVRPLAHRVMGSGAMAAGETMLGAVGFVLLIACANVASLLLARGTLRRRELALRASLGATRGSLIRLQLAESLLLSLVGGAVGFLSAVWSIPALRTIAPPDMPVFRSVGLDWTSFAFGLLLTLATGLMFGLIPAWIQTRGDLAPALQESSRGSTAGRHLLLKSLVVAEMALALVLVAATTLMIRSLIRMQSGDPGFDRQNLTAAHVLLSTSRYAEDAKVRDFFSRALSNLRRDGRTTSAALVQTIPLGGDNSYLRLLPEGASDPSQAKASGNMIVSPGYFQTMKIPLLAGRDFTDADNENAQRVAIVNETFVKRYWPKESPLGKRVRIGSEKAPWTTVVGMARDVRHDSLTEPPRPEIYRPHAQSPERIMMLVARSRGGTESAAGALRAAVGEVDSNQPLFRLQSFDAFLYARSAGERATTRCLAMLAVLALLLAGVGTYGVMAYAAAQRTREIGIRLALGASQRDVFRMMLRGGMTLAGIGVAVGLPAAYGVTPLLRSVGEALETKDGPAYAGVAAVLFLVGLAACAVPAWRAMRVDPARVLRNE